MLRHRQRDARDVDFLKRVASDQPAANLAGDADDGGESSIAVAMPVTMLVAPGPDVAMATRRRARARVAIAMCVAPCSCRTSTWRMG